MRADNKRCASLFKSCATGALPVMVAAASFFMTAGSVEAANSPALRLINLIPINGTASNPSKQINSFDISWFDPANGLYYLADRSNAAVDVVDTTGAFSGKPETLFAQGHLRCPDDHAAWRVVEGCRHSQAPQLPN